MHALPAAIVLTLSPAGGVLLLLFTRLFGFGTKGQALVKGIGNAAAASFMWCSVVMLFQEFVRDDIFAPLLASSGGSAMSGKNAGTAPDELRDLQRARIALSSLALGTAVSAKMIQWIAHMASSKGFIVAAVMFLHTAAEGAAIGLAADRSVYGSILFSLAVHNVPEGFVVAVASIDEIGWLKSTILVIFSHIPQPIAMFLFAWTARGPAALVKLPIAVEWMMQGLSLGSIAATCWYELVPEAAEDLGGRWRAYSLIAILGVLMYFVV